jgi:hypothetical protein
MSTPLRFKWLLVVEGSTDVKTYVRLLTHYGVDKNSFLILPAHGKGSVCNTANWDNINTSSYVPGNLLKVLQAGLTRTDFSGVILLVDSDADNRNAFAAYKRNDRLPYVGQPAIRNEGTHWYIDELNGKNIIPIYGINVPMNTSGCLETDLLDSYGFPVEGQPEYASIVDAIEKATIRWQIPKLGNDKNWWEENSRAKLDKFIYAAFSQGFKVSGETPRLPAEPDAIRQIRRLIG